MDQFLDIAESTGVWKAIGKYIDGRVEAGRIIRIAEAEVKRDDIKERARRRQEEEGIRHQVNMESVSIKAMSQINEDAKPDDVEDDWYANFFDKVRNVSDEDMQTVWSQLLSGAINTPGSFSTRTVNLFANLDKEDAESFATLCSFRCEIPVIEDDHRNFRIFPYIPRNFPHYKEYACISEETLLRLEEAGLIIQKFGFVVGEGLSGGHTDGHYFFFNSYYRRKILELKCHDGEILFRVPEDGAMPYGVVKFTQAGKELSRIVEQKCADGFLDFLKEHYPLAVSPR